MIRLRSAPPSGRPVRTSSTLLSSQGKRNDCMCDCSTPMPKSTAATKAGQHEGQHECGARSLLLVRGLHWAWRAAAQHLRGLAGVGLPTAGASATCLQLQAPTSRERAAAGARQQGGRAHSRGCPLPPRARQCCSGLAPSAVGGHGERKAAGSSEQNSSSFAVITWHALRYLF